MKKRTVLLFLAFSSPVWSLTYIGPPVNDLDKEKFEGGLNYSTGEADVKISGSDVSSIPPDIDLDSFFAVLGFGVGWNTKIYGRLGSGEVEDLGQEFALGVGLKNTLVDSPDLPWGIVIQVASFRGEKSGAIDGREVTGDLEFYYTQVAAGPTFKGDSFSFYGGPFGHWISGDYTLSVDDQDESINIEQESSFGGYAGCAIKVNDKVDITFEGQWTEDSSAYAVSACMKF